MDLDSNITYHIMLKSIFLFIEIVLRNIIFIFNEIVLTCVSFIF